MVKNHDVEKVVIVRKEKAEIYVKKDRLTLPRYKKYVDKGISTTGSSAQFTMQVDDHFAQKFEDAQLNVFKKDTIGKTKDEKARMQDSFDREKSLQALTTVRTGAVIF